jgi:hypothetical protein
MKQLTSGKYTRIWTPLAHDILFVDNSEGQSLPVQVLSRGTREQLFVSLRLALVSAYARRGIHLPMILDDVFVNYDAGRTRTACAVLQAFAKQGHQLLVFTCHEHVWRMFQDIKVDCRRIPNRHGEAVEEVVEVPAVSPTPEPLPEAIPEPVPESVVAELPPPPEPEAAPLPEPEPEPVKVKRKVTHRVVEVPVESPPVVMEEFVPPSAPSVMEIEYWWDSPRSQNVNGNGHAHHEGEAEVQADWAPQAEIEQHHW